MEAGSTVVRIVDIAGYRMLPFSFNGDIGTSERIRKFLLLPYPSFSYATLNIPPDLIFLPLQAASAICR